MDCSCAPILRFFSVATDGATTAPNLEPLLQNSTAVGPCTYINFIRKALTASVKFSNFASVIQKLLGMNKFVSTKSHTGSKFSKIFFEQLYTGWIVVVHQYCGFSLWRQTAPQLRQI